MEITIRIPAELHANMLRDLQRPHAHAYERVGFLYTIHKKMLDGSMIILAQNYEPVPDNCYLMDSSVGARIDSTSIRHSMQNVLDNQKGCFHVHLHNHSGKTSPSSTDLFGIPGVVESMASADSKLFHGYLILSRDSAYASVLSDNEFLTSIKTVIVGYPMLFIHNDRKTGRAQNRFSRQSFLGDNAQFLLENVSVGIIGYGGGGSHIGQQFAHLGVRNVTVFDNDRVEDTNMNRLIGAWFNDVKKRLLKTKVAERIFKKILPNNNLICIPDKWQTRPELLQQCDIVVGCVDTYAERQQLEAECRRYLMPYIDIGMDINSNKGEPYMSGQIILSMPGMPCMFCTGYLTDEKLGLEAAKYGNTGGRPQVVWANGLLASSAVGIFIDIVTGWTGQANKQIYLAYDGNNSTLTEHERLEYAEKQCSHYMLKNTGPVKFATL
jgi:hypothetical protein